MMMADLQGQPPLHVRRRGARAGEQQLHTMSELVTGKRYLLLSVLATAIAIASTYQKLATLTPTEWHQLLLEQQQNGTMTEMSNATAIGATDVMRASGSQQVDDAAEAMTGEGGSSMSAAVFVTELMRSRVSAAVRFFIGA